MASLAKTVLFGNNAMAAYTETYDVAAWLAHQIERGKREDFQVRAQLTPELAGLLLKHHNNRNRPMRPKRANEWSERLKAGKWLVTSQGISLGVDGNLNNGQHRCSGIVLSGVAVPCWIMFGEPVEAFYVLDTQQTRSASDALHILGEQNTQVLSAAARVLLVVSSTQPRSMTGSIGRAIDHATIAETVMNNPELRTAATFGQRFSSALPKTSTAGASVAYYLISTRSKHANRLPDFWTRVCSGVGIAHEKEPARVLRRGVETGRLIRIKSASGPYTAACIIIAWNMFVAGKLANGLSWPENEPFPVPR